MVFNIKLAQPTLDSIKRKRDMAWAFQDADGPGKARILLDTARLVAAGLPIRNDPRASYNEAFLLRVIPEIATRLDPSITRLARETQPDDEEPHASRLLKNMSNETLGLYAYQCVQWVTYNSMLVSALRDTNDVNRKYREDVVALDDAVNMLTCPDLHGNYAIHAMLALDAPAMQAGVKTLPGLFNGVHETLNTTRDYDAGVRKEWMLVAEYVTHQSLIAESDDIGEMRDLAERLRAVWANPQSDGEDLPQDVLGRVKEGLPDSHKIPPALIGVIGKGMEFDVVFGPEETRRTRSQDAGMEP